MGIAPINSLEPSPAILIQPLSRLTSSARRGSVHGRSAVFYPRMKKLFVILTIVAAGQYLVAQVPSGSSVSIPAKDAKNHVGEDATVSGRISEIFVSSQTTNVYLYLDGDIKNAKFAVVFYGTNNPPVKDLRFTPKRRPGEAHFCQRQNHYRKACARNNGEFLVRNQSMMPNMTVWKSRFPPWIVSQNVANCVLIGLFSHCSSAPSAPVGRR